MGRKCIVPLCKTGYLAKGKDVEKISLFTSPSEVFKIWPTKHTELMGVKIEG